MCNVGCDLYISLLNQIISDNTMILAMKNRHLLLKKYDCRAKNRLIFSVGCRQLHQISVGRYTVSSLLPLLELNSCSPARFPPSPWAEDIGGTGVGWVSLRWKHLHTSSPSNFRRFTSIQMFHTQTHAKLIKHWLLDRPTTVCASCS